MRVQEAKRDFYRQLAKKMGFRSRAAFKLIQINQKYRVIKPGDVVVDFGCAPGGWLQVASKAVGKDGFVLGIDLKRVEGIEGNVSTIVADVMNGDIDKMVLSKLPRMADVVLSDLAPKVSGVWELDHIKQIDLTRRVVSILPQILRRGGSAILKVFEGEMFNDIVKEVEKVFKVVRIIKPKASRSKSSEVYLLCTDFRGY
ncbi:MAG: RlmE family RNA methyltransferase [Nitrososphaerales archaeon]|nr:RlmE family RNA methyltransferase [Nitrososphaerales archaeon]